MITNQQLLTGSRVRVTIWRKGQHVRDYYGTVTGWAKSGNVYLKADDGKHKTVSPESCKLIKQ